MEVQGEDSAFPEDVFGSPHPGYGKWASCIRLLDITNTTV
jgi:hypothetical protein